MNQINNSIYEELGKKWYESQDNPVALLRAESRLRNPWVDSKIREVFGPGINKSQTKILDVACGGGFLSNFLAKDGYPVQGIDLSDGSLHIAREYDETKSVQYTTANASHLPFKNNCFDVVCAMDFLEHIDHPNKMIAEMSRVLRPGGIFFFHTFNRNLISWFLIIKAVEIFVKNTPPNMHILKLFIKPEEMKSYCKQAHLNVKEFIGLKPNLMKIDTLASFLKREVSKDFSFSFTPSLLTSYSGYAIKQLGAPGA